MVTVKVNQTSYQKWQEERLQRNRKPSLQPRLSLSGQVASVKWEEAKGTSIGRVVVDYARQAHRDLHVINTSAEDMQKLHKSHLSPLMVENNASTLSLNTIAAAAPPPIPSRSTKKKHSRDSIGTRHSHESHNISPHPSESGLSDGAGAESNTTSQTGEEEYVNSPVSYHSTEGPPRHHSGADTGLRSCFTKRRKPPAVPDRRAKPGVRLHRSLHEEVKPADSGLARTKTLPEWGLDQDDQTNSESEAEREPVVSSEKKDKHSLGFAALAQALQDAGACRRSSSRSRKSATAAASGDITPKSEKHSHHHHSHHDGQRDTPGIVVHDVEDEKNNETLHKREGGKWYQASGWTTFA